MTSNRFQYVEGERTEKNFFVDTTNGYFNQFTVVHASFNAHGEAYSSRVARHPNGDEVRYSTLAEALQWGYNLYPQDKPVTTQGVTTMTQTIVQFTDTEDTVSQVPLSSLVRLDASGIENSQYAVRELNREHVSHLAVSDASQWPNLEGVNTSTGTIVIDGYHRWYASLVKGVYSILLGAMSESNDKTEKHAFNDALDYVLNPTSNVTLTEEQSSKLTSLSHRFTLPVHVKPYTSPHDVLVAAFNANLKHGLPASSGSRTQYGLWLLASAKSEGRELSVRQAAIQAGISNVTLSEAYNKEQKRREKAEREVEEATSGETDEAGTLSAKEAVKASKSFVSAMRKFTDLLEGYENDKDIVPSLVEALKNDSDVFVLERVSKLLTLVKQKRNKQVKQTSLPLE